MIKVEPPGRRSVPRLRRLPRVEPQPALAHRRPEVGARPRGVRPPARHRRRGRGVVPARRDGTPRLRLRHRARRAPRVVYLSCPAYPDGHRFAQRPGYDALVQASSGQMWEQPGWRMGPIFLHMPMPSMGAFFLISTGVLTALIARENTGRGQHVTTSLFAGAMLYTTQIWQHLEKSNAAAARADGQVVPARHPPDDDLRVRRRVGARVDHERPHADEDAGRDPRSRGRARPVRVHGAAAPTSARRSPRSAGRSSRSGSATTSSPRSRSTITRSRRSSRPTSSSRTRN